MPTPKATEHLGPRRIKLPTTPNNRDRRTALKPLQPQTRLEGKARGEAHNGASNHDVLQHAREAEASQQDIEWDKASSDQMQFQR
jgi:hypothetical protein